MDDSLYKVARYDWNLFLSPHECFTQPDPWDSQGASHHAEYRHWYGKNREYHPWPELYYVFDGHEIFGWGDRTGVVPSSSVLLIPPYQSHAYLYPPGFRTAYNIWISLGDANVAIMYYARGTELSTLPVIGHCAVLEGAIPLLTDTWNSLMSYDPHGPDYALIREKLRLYVSALLLQSVELLLRQQNQDQAPQGVEKIKSFIDAHPGISYSLEELSDLAGYSKYHFHRLFTRFTGKTPKAYMTQRRITWACELLKRGSSCKAAAAELGFSDPAAFSRWFKTGSGVSPGEWFRLKG